MLLFLASHEKGDHGLLNQDEREEVATNTEIKYQESAGKEVPAPASLKNVEKDVSISSLCDEFGQSEDAAVHLGGKGTQ